jgi:hypothetical protein
MRTVTAEGRPKMGEGDIYTMKLIRNSLLPSLAALLVASSLQAAPHRSVVIVVDPLSGMALIPDGTAIPHGITVNGRDGKPLVFTHAPEETFAASRATVAATAPAEGAFGPSFISRDRRVDSGVPKIPRLRFAADDSDVTYYVNFVDGSYVSARRIVTDYGQAGIYYGVQTAAYTPAGDYYSGTLSASQSSTDKPGFDTSASCFINSSGGYCSTGVYAYQWTDPFSAHVVSQGYIHHHYLPICGRYGEPPCDENYSGSIDIYFP